MAQTNESQEQVTVNVETLQPVTRTLMTIGGLPTSYLISMTYEEQLLWLQNYLIQTVIPAINNNAEATEEVQDIVMALQNYINDYFNNLDVQEEINNKLDEMAQDGSLTTLIENYVNPYIQAQNQEINEFKTSVNNQITIQNTQIQSVASGSPLVASNVSEMTETTRVYVNTTDGNWYYYNGSAWTVGGVYQATSIQDDEVKTNNLDTQIIKKYTNEMYSEDGSNIITPLTPSFSDTTNHQLYPIRDTINLESGIYFVGMKLICTSLTENAKIRLRAGMRVDGTNRNILTTNDLFKDIMIYSSDDMNKIQYGYGYMVITTETVAQCRNIFTLINQSGTNPIAAEFSILDCYAIKVSEANAETMSNIAECIEYYAQQKSYPKINLLPSDKNNILGDIPQRIDNIENTINTGDDLPEYLKTTRDNIIANFEPKAKTLSVIFQTDLHSNDNELYKNPAVNSIKMANSLIQNLPISFNILGGDYIANGTTTTKAEAKKYIEDLISYLKYNIPQVLLRGNHDINQLQSDTNEIMTDLELFNIIGKKYLTNNLKIATNNNIASPLYGYIDFEFQKIRVVFVNTSDGYDQNLKIGNGNMNTTQLQWLADNAFDLTGKEDYQVVVFGHYPIYDFTDETASVEQGRLNPFKQLLIAFKNGTNLNYTTGGINYTVIKDFTNQGPKTLIAYICGHIHDDKSIATTDGILQISTTNAGYYGKENNSGTSNELAFDIYNFDTINRQINITRIGYGNNRNFNY